MLSSQLYVVGSACYVVASVYLIPSLELAYKGCIGLFIVGSVLYVLAAVVDFGDAYAAHRARSRCPAGAVTEELLTADDTAKPYRWLRGPAEVESLFTNGCSLAGGLLFLAGSVLFWPALGAVSKSQAGTFVFRAGSCCYITGSLCGLVRLLSPARVGDTLSGAPLPRALWVATLIQFLCGSSLFITGGVVLNQGLTAAGAKSWLAGSVAFLGGSLTNAVAGWLPPPPRPCTPEEQVDGEMDSV